MTSETLAKSVASERGSAARAALLLLLTVGLVLGLYWAVGLATMEGKKRAQAQNSGHDYESYEPNEEDYDYLDDDDFEDPDEEYDEELLEEENEEIEYEDEHSRKNTS
jgi:hypothetical protein